MVKKNKVYSEHEIAIELRDVFSRYLVDTSVKERTTYSLDNPQIQFVLSCFSGIFGIVDFPNRKYLYVSDSVEDLLGIKVETFLDNGIAGIMKCFVPEEAILFAEAIFPSIFEYFQQNAHEHKALETKISYTTRLYLKDGTTKWFLHQIIPLEVDSNGMPIIGLKLVIDVDGAKKDRNIDLMISRKDEKGIFRAVFEKSIIPRKIQISITEREREVLLLTSQGLSAKKISEELYISQHTVINHKKNMLKKFNISSSNELVRFGMVNGLIG